MQCIKKSLISINQRSCQILHCYYAELGDIKGTNIVRGMEEKEYEQEYEPVKEIKRKTSRRNRNSNMSEKDLKVPQCEIFYNSDFHDFYTIITLWGAFLGLNKIFRGFIWAGKISYTYAQSNLRRFFLIWTQKIILWNCGTFETICLCQ